MEIHKSHSKTDLIDLINTINIKIIFNHQDNKKDLQNKFIEYIQNNNLQYQENVYRINNTRELELYLIKDNPKRIVNVKQKNIIMSICKGIIYYSKNNYKLEFTNYKTYQELEDDMDYIKQFGDIPSVRRCCKLMNRDNKKSKDYIPLISPQVQKDLEEKHSHIVKKNCITIRHGSFTLFDK